jgi:hypothetical protein
LPGKANIHNRLIGANRRGNEILTSLFGSQSLCFADVMGGFPQNVWLPTAFNFAVRHEQSS